MKTAADFSSEVGNSHGKNWRVWLAHLVGKAKACGCELGTWRGESAEWMLENIFTGEGAAYWCVDTFKGSEEHRLAGIDCANLYDVAFERLKRFPGAKLYPLESHTFLQMAKGMVDFFYIDAAHDAMNVLRDSVLAWEHLVPGGIMVWDDYEWTSMADEIDRPKMAIDAFLACYSRELEIIDVGWQVAVKKIR